VLAPTPRAAVTKINIYRDVSATVMAHLSRILGGSAILAVGIRAVYGHGRCGG
jgi:hypothetical protein